MQRAQRFIKEFYKSVPIVQKIKIDILLLLSDNLN
jgi:hypothetical protein